MYRAVVGVGVACALVIVVAYELTRPIIQRNRSELRQRAIIDVLPGTVTSAAFRQTDRGEFERTAVDSDAPDLVFAGYDEQGRLVGLAFETQGIGYQDELRILYGYSFEAEAITGMRVLKSRETPGLGDRIETDPQFLRNFEKLDVRVTTDGERLAHPVEFVKPDAKTAAWQIDGISGATISSQAIANMIRNSSARWVPRVHNRKADFLQTADAQ